MTMAYHICYSIIDDCQNILDSYGEICVRCNKCGRWTKQEQEQAEGEQVERDEA